ncbi:MAG: HEAT repeat domain-containing protein, partial [Erysipelotrichaceae bacterium]
MMKGYKVTDENMRCLEIQYKLGEIYRLKGELKLFQSGFHFYKKLIAIDDYYFLKSNSRVFEIEAIGTVKTRKLDSCTDKIKFIRELSKAEISKMIEVYAKDKDTNIREMLAKSKFTSVETLEILSKDESSDVRYEVVENSNINLKILEKLSRDKESRIREMVAQN